MVEAALKFHGYDVEEIEYALNKNYVIDFHEATISPEFVFKITYNKDNPLQYNIILGVRIGYEESGMNLPFRAEVIIRGYYEMKQESEDIEELDVFFVRNGCAILFPYVRALLTDITSKGRHNRVTLPTMNFYKLIEDADPKDYFLTSAEYREYRTF